jgi:hypothetical protein
MTKKIESILNADYENVKTKLKVIGTKSLLTRLENLNKLEQDKVMLALRALSDYWTERNKAFRYWQFAALKKGNPYAKRKLRNSGGSV